MRSATRLMLMLLTHGSVLLAVCAGSVLAYLLLQREPPSPPREWLSEVPPATTLPPFSRVDRWIMDLGWDQSTTAVRQCALRRAGWLNDHARARARSARRCGQHAVSRIWMETTSARVPQHCCVGRHARARTARRGPTRTRTLLVRRCCCCCWEWEALGSASRLPAAQRSPERRRWGGTAGTASAAAAR